MPTSRARRCVPPVPGEHAERHFGEADLAGVAAGDADVGRHRDFESAADAMAVQRCDDQLRRLLQPVQRFVRVQAEVVLELRRHRAQHRDVGTGTEEALARTPQHDHVHVRIEARLQNRLVQLAHHFIAVAIGRRHVQFEYGDATLGGIANAVRVGHRITPGANSIFDMRGGSYQAASCPTSPLIQPLGGDKDPNSAEMSFPFRAEGADGPHVLRGRIPARFCGIVPRVFLRIAAWV